MNEKDKKKNTPIKKKGMNRQFTKQYIEVFNKHMKNESFCDSN